MNGKGSSPRRKTVDQKTWDENWNSIFGKKNKGVKVEFIKNEEKFYGYITRRLDANSYEISFDQETIVLSPKDFKEV